MFRGMFPITMLFKGLFLLVIGYCFLLLEKIFLETFERNVLFTVLLPDVRLSDLTHLKNRN